MGAAQYAAWHPGGAGLEPWHPREGPKAGADSSGIETERRDQPEQSHFINTLNTGSCLGRAKPQAKGRSSRTNGQTAGRDTHPKMLCPCRSHSPHPLPSDAHTEAQAQSWSPPQRQAWPGGQVGRPAHSSCLQASSSPGTLGYQRIEHVEHEGHQSCHGAQNKVSETALVWCGRATWRGAHPVLGPPGTQGRRPLGYRLLLGLQLLPNPGSLRHAETAISTQGRGEGVGGPSVPKTPGHDSPAQRNRC